MVAAWEAAGATVFVAGAASLSLRRAGGVVAGHLAGRPADAAVAWHGLPRLPQIARACGRAGVALAAHAGNPLRLSAAQRLRYRLEDLLFRHPGPRPVVACCSEHVAAAFHADGYLRRYPTRVIFNGIELPAGRAAVRPFDPAQTDSAAPFTLGMTARLDPIKDHPTLLRAFATVRDRFPTARLELAGDGRSRGMLEGLAAELNLTGAVRFLGNVPDVYGAMANWDLFAYATTADEGLGNAVSEALAFGLPTVLTDVGPMRSFHEVIDDGEGAGESVRLVPPADPAALAAAICELIPDVAARRRLAEVGRALAWERFHPHRFAVRHAELLGLPTPREPAPAEPADG